MAYNPSTHGHENSWSQDNTESQSLTFPLPKVMSSEETETQEAQHYWDSQESTYAAYDYGAYTPNNNFQRPLSQPNLTSNASFPRGADTILRSQHNPMAHCPSSQSYFDYRLHHGSVYQTEPHRTNPTFTTTTPATALTSPLEPLAPDPPHPPLPSTTGLAIPSHQPIHPPPTPNTNTNTTTAATQAEYSVPCPYRCGTVLTGVHALGNLTRHLKTQACTGSSRAKVRYLCPMDGCEKLYARSDGLRVHMRRRHGAPLAVPRTDGVVDKDEE